MTTEEIIEQIKEESDVIREKMNKSVQTSCPHVLCVECAKAEIERIKENEMLMVNLREKEELINNLISTQ
jgi:hypothetical protein